MSTHGRAGQSVDRNKREEQAAASMALGAWMAAALDDPRVCEEMKQDINRWFNAAMPVPEKREPVKATDEDVERAVEAYMKVRSLWMLNPWQTMTEQTRINYRIAMRAALESFAANLSMGKAVPTYQIQKGDGCWEDITPERYAAIHAGDLGRDQDLPCETRVLYAATEVTK